MRILFVLLLAVLVTAFTCRKTGQDENEYATYQYKETQCADPWRRENTDNATLNNVTKYLTAQGLQVKSLEIKSDDIAAVCLACICKTGKTIYVTSFADDSTKARFQRIGFQQ